MGWTVGRIADDLNMTKMGVLYWVDKLGLKVCTLYSSRFNTNHPILFLTERQKRKLVSAVLKCKRETAVKRLDKVEKELKQRRYIY